ncbi:muts domain V-domain-containing protein [Coniochaeta sp. 2T2.1]|nr:muts domain V-domain-containing protein [Coniochaeta sp. 2T2.1]
MMPPLLRIPATLRWPVGCPRAPILYNAGAGVTLVGHRSLNAWRQSHAHVHNHQVRGKKTKTTVSFDALPQGPLPGRELPQGPLPAPDGAADEPPPEEESGPAYPTVVMQARRNMNKYDNCVLLTRVGGFYELYFEHAEKYGPLLNLKVAQKKTGAGPVPMAGFPFFQLDRFLKLLVQDLNCYVAIAEEFPNDASAKVKSGGLMHDRRVARIITPGTLIDENFMDPYVNNYVMSVHVTAPTPEPSRKGRKDEEALGLAWLDLSTGSFYTQATDILSLSSTLAQLSPREVVLDDSFQGKKEHKVLSILEEEKYLISYAPQGELQGLDDWSPMLESEIPTSSVNTFTDVEIKAGSLLLNYVKDRLQGLSMKLQPPMRYESRQVMAIDKNSMRSLEIKSTIRDNVFRGSLLHAIRRTVTKSGARLLSEWITAPSTSLEVVTSRQDLVSRFIDDIPLRDGIILLLHRSHDSQRLVQKFALNRGDPDDLLRLASTIDATSQIVDLIKSRLPPSGGDECLTTLVSRIGLTAPLALAKLIRSSIDEEGLSVKHQLEDSEEGEMIALAQQVVSAEGTSPADDILPKTARKKTSTTSSSSPPSSITKPTSLREQYGEDTEIWIMKPGASPALQRLHADLALLLSERASLTETLRARLGASSLTLRWTPGLGHICHVKGKDARNTTSPTNTTISSSRSTRSFHQPEWTSLGERLDRTRFQIRQEEQRVFASLREAVVLCLVKLRRNAAVLDELDITTSFARLAVEQDLVRPIMTDSPDDPRRGATHTTPETTILGGRHATVQGGLTVQGRTFTANDLTIGGASGQQNGRLWLITGPNMGGKSTFLRQNALMAILAQAGCFVPATYAKMGVVDALFSRVGSADNLYADQSTFMVEMLETAAILRRATPKSFVIMDEIGRGTTPDAGTAVAFAALHHLVTVNRCRALFATHFHEIADMVRARGLAVGYKGGEGGVEMYCTDVEEDGYGGFSYVHRLRKGVNRDSHALKVARMAGMPEEALRVARELLGEAPEVGEDLSWPYNMMAARVPRSGWSPADDDVI